MVRATAAGVSLGFMHLQVPIVMNMWMNALVVLDAFTVDVVTS